MIPYLRFTHRLGIMDPAHTLSRYVERGECSISVSYNHKPQERVTHITQLPYLGMAEESKWPDAYIPEQINDDIKVVHALNTNTNTGNNVRYHIRAVSSPFRYTYAKDDIGDPSKLAAEYYELTIHVGTALHTPYDGGVFLLWLQFPCEGTSYVTFPSLPFRAAFATPIYHPAVSRTRLCHVITSHTHIRLLSNCGTWIITVTFFSCCHVIP
jgi:ubiquitin-protein ligase